jgi:hypothetical protein
MAETIIVALLSLAGTLAGSYLSTRRSAALVAYRLEELEKKVAKHNSVVERTYALEKQVDIIEEKVKVSNRRIDDLEQEEKAAHHEH